MQTAQKLEADAAMQKDDAPVTQRDLKRLMIKLSEITDNYYYLRPIEHYQCAAFHM